MTHTLAADGKHFFDHINSYLDQDDRLRVQEAFTLARREHGNQRRKSGELFFTHPLTVAYYLTEYQLDAPAIIAALLHDVAEDTKISIPVIESHFGEEVARLVDGVTKLKDVTEGISKNGRLTKQEIEDATLHKLLGVMTVDPRAVIIKLFDRLHNMRTIKATPYDSQVHKAKETLSVYAPLANRLGIWCVKNELEALSLEVLDNDAFTIIQQQQAYLKRQQQNDYQLISGQIFEVLLQANIDVRNVLLDPENTFTIYQDLSQAGSSFYAIDRTMRLVILLDDVPSCYLALGHLHQLWQPIPGKFDDYIAVPRDNLYRSLHTAVIHNNGQHLKLRLRTVAMDKVDSIGILSRWLYKGTPLWSQGIADRIDTFLGNISESINVEPQNPSQSVKGAVEDVLGEQIRVYTPQGDMRDLTKGATPIDFAYAIHTGLGEQCSAAFVNDVPYPLNKPLRDGDQVRIVKRTRAQPIRAWLDEDLGYLVTNYARSHVRRWFRRLTDDTAVAQGKSLLEDELTMLGIPHYSHQKIASLFNYENIETLYHDLGRADLLPTTVALHLLEEIWNDEPLRALDNVVYAANGERFVVTHADRSQLRLCGTCQPRPPGSIVGFIRHDGGVTIHNRTCHTLRPDKMTGRMLKLGWAETPRQARQVNIQVKVFDRPGLLFEITHLIQDEQINIAFIHTPPAISTGEVHIDLTLEVVKPRQMVRILHQIQALHNIFSVQSFPTQSTFAKDLLPSNSLYRPE